MTFYDDLATFGDATAFAQENNETFSYARIAEDADAFAAQLRRAEPAGRKLVFILAGNCLASITGYLGCLRSRNPAALLPGSIQPELLGRLLEVYRPNYIWLPQSRACEIAQQPIFESGKYSLTAYSAEPIVMYTDLALLMTTSGSTGSPKFVRQSYRNLAANASSISDCLAIDKSDRAITTLPMHYVYGLSVINSHLHSAASVALTEASLTEKRFWEFFKGSGATTISGVPYTYELLKRLNWQSMDLPSLRVLTQAGGKLSPELVRQFAGTCLNRGLRFYVMYGAAEATARMTYLPTDKALEKPASIGMAIPGGELWIDNEELCYKGENVSLGYAESRHDLARGDDRHGVLKTGDLATRDHDGDFYITGRKSRFVKLFGIRTNLDEVEQFIRDRGIECACAGEDDALRLYVSNAAEEQKALVFAQQLTNLHRSAVRSFVVAEIPRNDAGKIVYGALP